MTDRAKMAKAASLIAQAPLIVIAALTGVSIALMVLLLLDSFTTTLVWTIGPLVGFGFGLVAYRLTKHLDRPGSLREQVAWDIIALVFVLVWGGFNIFYTSQHILTNRDPATYTMGSVWLSNNESIKIQPDDVLNSTQTKEISIASAGFDTNPRQVEGVIHAQGQHLLPALLGAAGKFVGDKDILHLNILFGMTALMAIYSLGRMFVRSYWALLATGVVGASLPLIYFSRDTYTEPLALTFIVGGLAFVWVAQATSSRLAWLIAGFVMGASALARIDSYLSIIGMAFFLVLYILFLQSNQRKERFMHTLYFTVGLLVCGAIAWLDLILLSYPYYVSTKGFILLEIAALSAVAFGGLILYYAMRRFPGWFNQLNIKTVRWRAIAVVLLTLTFAAFLVSRVAWLDTTKVYHAQYTEQSVSEQAPLVRETERERTTYWASWYIGNTYMFVGLLAFLYLTYRLLDNKKIQSDNAMMLPLLSVLGFTAAVYFIEPKIFPDQIWATRRMLPVIIPGFALLGAFGAEYLFNKVRFPNSVTRNIAVSMIVVMVVAQPLMISRPFIKHRERTDYAFTDVCQYVKKGDAVLWLGKARLEAVVPTVAYCGIDGYNARINMSEASSVSKLRDIVASAPGAVYIGVYGYQINEYIKNQDAFSVVASIARSEIHNETEVYPYYVKSGTLEIYLAQFNADGTFTSVEKKTE